MSTPTGSTEDTGLFGMDFGGFALITSATSKGLMSAGENLRGLGEGETGATETN